MLVPVNLLSNSLASEANDNGVCPIVMGNDFGGSGGRVSQDERVCMLDSWRLRDSSIILLMYHGMHYPRIEEWYKGNNINVVRKDNIIKYLCGIIFVRYHRIAILQSFNTFIV